MDNQLTQRGNATSMLGQEERWKLDAAGRIKTLLSHFWRADDPEMLTQAIARDWVDAMTGLPIAAIKSACSEYVRTKTRKPTPADIVKLARKFAHRSQKKSGEFSVDFDLERQAVQLLEEGLPYAEWPRHILEYKVQACGGLQFAEWVTENKGWFRQGGPGLCILQKSESGM